MPSLKQRFAGVAAPRFGDGAADDVPAGRTKSQKRDVLATGTQSRDEASSRVRDELSALAALVDVLGADLGQLARKVDKLSDTVKAQAMARHLDQSGPRPGAALGGVSAGVQWLEGDGVPRRPGR